MNYYPSIILDNDVYTVFTLLMKMIVMIMVMMMMIICRRELRVFRKSIDVSGQRVVSYHHPLCRPSVRCVGHQRGMIMMIIMMVMMVMMIMMVMVMVDY
jgi:hypothetical protein